MRQIVVDALEESAYPWERLLVRDGQPWPLNVKFMDPAAPIGSAGGMTFPTDLDMIAGSVDHELGHVLGMRLLDSSQRLFWSSRYCDHDPKHGWWASNSTPYVYAGTENFANAYQTAFHQPNGFGLMGHNAPVEDREWFIDWILSL